MTSRRIGCRSSGASTLALVPRRLVSRFAAPDGEAFGRPESMTGWPPWATSCCVTCGRGRSSPAAKRSTCWSAAASSPPSAPILSTRARRQMLPSSSTGREGCCCRVSPTSTPTSIRRGSGCPSARTRQRRRWPGSSRTTGSTGAPPRNRWQPGPRERSVRRSPPARRSCAATSRWTPTAASNDCTGCSPLATPMLGVAGSRSSPSHRPASCATRAPTRSSTQRSARALTWSVASTRALSIATPCGTSTPCSASPSGIRSASTCTSTNRASSVRSRSN